MPTVEELRNEIKELRCRIDATQIKLNGFMEHVENSMKQANQNYQSWQDRQDVDRALDVWAETLLPGWKTYLLKEDFSAMNFDIKNMKDFALFFAERVKGAPLNSPGKPEDCDHCFPRKADGTLMPCEFCGREKGRDPIMDLYGDMKPDAE